MKYAFTMIELIFVIVILGVLAATAIPKLSATRDDAITARMAQVISVAVSEIAAYAIAKGQTNNDLSIMSKAIESLVTRNEATLDLGNNAVDIIMGARANCVRLALINSGEDENLTVILGASGDGRCDALHNIFDSAIFPIAVRGEQVVY